MADIATLLLDRFSACLNDESQPISEMVNARLQRIQELERVRLEHSAEHSGSSGDAAARHSRRDRFIRQSSQQRSTGRRFFSSNIQRTPVRSQSFDNTSSAAVGANSNDDTLDFRQHVENTRPNLFWPRASSSSENIVSGSTYRRRQSDSPVTESMADFQTGSDSGSGSSSPRVSLRSQIDITSGMAEAFSSIRCSMIGSDSNVSSRGSRSSSITHEARNSSSTNLQRFAITNSNGGSLTRSASLRAPRRESRFRRRTIEGVDRNITHALEHERMQVTSSSSSASRSMSPLVTQSSMSELVISESTSRTQSTEVTHASGFSSYSSAYARRSKTVDLYPEDSVPVLGFGDENVIFVDSDGKCHWLNKNHLLLRAIKATNKLPDIVRKPKLPITKAEDSDGYIATMEGDSDARCSKLRELVFLAKRRDAHFKNGDFPDSATSLSLLELYQRGDFIEEGNNDEKYKSVSLYTPPRTRPDLDSYILSKEVLPLYDGIAEENLPQEVKDRVKSETEEINDGANSNIQSSSSSYSQSASYTRTELNGATTRSEQSRSEESCEQSFSDTLNRNGNTSAAYARSDVQHEAYSTEIQSDQSETLRYSRSNETEQQLETQYTDSASTITQSRAEARRQQYLVERQSSENGRTILQQRAEERQQRYLEDRQSSENGSTIIQRRAEERQLQYLAEEHASEDGSRVSKAWSERQQRVLSESRTGRNVQQRAEERHQHYRSTRTDSTENTSTSVRQVEQSSMERQSSQTNMDNSNLHSEVNLVMERLRIMHENTNIPLDTSHLGLEEMQMIQKALAENPSPPDSPVEFESSEFTTGDIISISNEESETKQPTNIIIDATAGITDTLILNPDQLTSNINHSIIGETENSSVVSDLTENSSSSMQTSSSNTTFISARQDVISTSSVLSSVRDNVVEARTPRYQRLPSEGVETRLALPTIDWSPLERSNSPLSPNRFSFEEQQTENTDSTSSKPSETVLPNKHTIPKVNQSISQTGSIHSVQSELTIEIPPDSPITSLNLTNGSDSSPMNSLSLTNPRDCNKSSFSSGSEASSAGSETVTTVFEEFVQTIPSSMLYEWSTSQTDNN